ncbi:MAG TPA: ATP-binding cassette domain-containing protein, partial [Casimicrobiaceae bacterium]|nr:ATP-binding cassette domain-containing protein [Casimicrobiaceae bacterium]
PRIMRGDKIGLIGANGTGKTTLLKLILGEIEPDAGRIRLGSKVDVAYFDQFRGALDDEATLADTISPGSDFVEIDGTRKHVISYLGDFLFPPERARAPVKSLSGGERNRLLLARLFARPANVLVLDEPTNDLDIETLELLEQFLVDWPGTLVLVSHDRRFIDNVVTSTLVFEGDGRVAEYVGGYEDWLRQRPTPEADEAPERRKADTPAPITPPARKKLSYREQLEHGELPSRIEALEREHEAITARIAEPDFYKEGADGIAAALARASAIEDELLTAYARWDELDSRNRKPT